MNKLNLKLKGGKLKDLIIKIDNKEIAFKKNKFGNFEFGYETENNSVNIKIQRFLEIQSKFWFLWQILFFIVSLFGILDRRIDRKCVVIDAEYKIKIDENTSADFAFDYTKPDNVLKLKTEAEFKEIKNNSYIDKQSKKRLKTLLLTKIFIVIGIALFAVLLIVLLK